MSVTLIIPTTFRTYTERQSEIELSGNTVKEVVDNLIEKYPEIKRIIIDSNEQPFSYLNIFIGSKNIKQLQGYESPVRDGDTVVIIPAIAGGSGVKSVLGDNPGEKLDNDEILRYSRHLLLKEVGVKGQKKLKAAKVLIIGMGGLGAPLVQYLAAAGVGTLGVVDFDEVDATNLQRQVIHRTRDIGRPKVSSAKDYVRAINPKIKVETYNYKLDADNILDLIKQYDVIADATDNYVARYLISDACAIAGKPDVFAAIYQFEGQVTVFYNEYGPCYRCLYPAPPPAGLIPTCSQGGVLGVLGGIVGGILMLKIGINKALWLFGIGQIVTILGYVLIAHVWKHPDFIPGILNWLSSQGIYSGSVEFAFPSVFLLSLVVGAEALGAGLGTACFVAYMCRETNRAYVATQLALFTALSAIPRTVCVAFTGYAIKWAGWENFFIICYALAIPGMVMLIYIAPFHSKENSGE